MADFFAGDTPYDALTVSSSHSRQGSVSTGSDKSHGKNEEHVYQGLDRRGSEVSDSGSQQLVLRDGGRLTEESKTEHGMSGYDNHMLTSPQNGSTEGSRRNPDVPPRMPVGGGTGTARAKVSKTGSTSIPEVEFAIPDDGNLSSFSADAMASFMKCLRVEDRIIGHLHRQSLDGRKFGRLKDNELENLNLKNPVLVYFRDRTAAAVTKKPKQRVPFIL